MKSLLVFIVSVFAVFGCRPMDKKTNINPSVKNKADKYISLDLQDSFDPERLVKSFPKYGLKVHCVIEKEQNIVLYSFNTKKINKVPLQKFLSYEVGVEKATEHTKCPD